MLNIVVHFEKNYGRINIYLAFIDEIRMKCNINLLVSFLFVTYFYCTKVFKFCVQLIKTQWKHGGFHNEFFFLNLNLLCYVYVENYHIWNLDLNFLVHFTMLRSPWVVPLGMSHLNFPRPIELKIIGNI
jgi:hypothetical protein